MATEAEHRQAASGDLEADEEGAERQPLLAKSVRIDGKHDAILARFQHVWRGPVVDTMTYKVDTLTGWSAFVLEGPKTAWSSSSAWRMLLKLTFLSILAAVLVVASVPDPARLKTSKLQTISQFLRVIVGLLLGFFLTSSVNRWFQCTDGFLQIFDAIRNLQMQILALGVPADLRFKCVRYGVVSTYLLARTLKIEAMQVKEERLAATEQMWAEVLDDQGDQEPTPRDDSVMHKYIALTKAEVDMLKTCEDPADMIWIWVASLNGRMSQDGWIPPMASPTYGRIMNLVQAAHSGIRTVKLAIIVQAPFNYVHMLATLVHVNNIFNAISFGIVTGSTIGTMLQFSGRGLTYERNNINHGVIISDVENLVISFVISLVGPFLYQVLLEVSLRIAQPFSSAEGEIPTERLLDGLQRGLSDATRIGDAPPSWEAPFLKAPAAPKAAAPATSPHKQP